MSWAYVLVTLGLSRDHVGLLLGHAKGVVARIGAILRVIFGVKASHVTSGLLLFISFFFLLLSFSRFKFYL